MEKVGFFGDDSSEAVQALEEHVLVKKLFGGPEGLEIVHAGANSGIGAGIRRVQAMNRLDIPMLWRALIRRAESKKAGPVISLLAPRGTSTADASSTLMSARITAGDMAAGETSVDCAFDADTPASTLLEFAVAAVTALTGPPRSGQWQWTVRAKGLVPR